MNVRRCVALAMVWGACAQQTPVPAAEEAVPTAAPALEAPPVARPDPATTYGGAFDESVPFVELAEIQAGPEAWLGQAVRTAGQVERVCKKAGCWLELGAPGSLPLRVPMAGHAFSVPQALVGRRAEIQGTLSAQPLPTGHRAHVASEGATALGPLALTASAVKPLP